MVQDIRARAEVLRKEGRCFLCLSKGHCIYQCTSSRKCRRCPGRHHQSTCNTSTSPLQAPVTVVQCYSPATTNPAATDNSQIVNSSLASITQSRSRVLLHAARTFAHSDQCSEAVPARILMDGGHMSPCLSRISCDYVRLKLKFLI